MNCSSNDFKHSKIEPFIPTEKIVQSVAVAASTDDLHVVGFAVPAGQRGKLTPVLISVRRGDQRDGHPPWILRGPGGEIHGQIQPGHRGDRAGPAPLPPRTPGLSERDGHRRPAQGAHGLRLQKPKHRILPGAPARWAAPSLS